MKLKFSMVFVVVSVVALLRRRRQRSTPGSVSLLLLRCLGYVSVGVH